MAEKFSIGKLPLRWKLKIIILTVASIICIIAGTAIIPYQHNMLRSMLLSDLNTEAEITAYNTAAALSFLDGDAARESLSALKNDKSVTIAVLYDKEGNFFAGYVRKGIELEIPLRSGWDNTIITELYLTVSKPVILDKEQIGTISVAADLSVLNQTSLRSTITVVIVMIISLLAAALVSIKLEQIIYKPVMGIAKTANKISKSRDYSLRAEKRSEDELGMLAEAFNDMLEQIQTRDRELHAHKDHLEGLVGERTRDLNETNVKLTQELTERKRIEEELRHAKEEAEKATVLKDKFLSLISHDLRSPLQGILIYMDLICESKDSKLSEEEREEMVSMVKATVEGMSEMVNRLIEVSKLQSSGMRPSRRLIKAHKLISKKMKSLQPFAREKGIALVNELPLEMFIAVDPDLFGEVIYNLISNALKFCERGDKITLFLPEKADNAVIAVKDTGPGIDEIFLENLFRHEIKTSRTGTAGEKGTGLGLPLCMDIMKAHGGDLRVESAPGKGSIFFLEFPPMGDFIIIADDQDVWRSTMQEHLSNNFEPIIIEAENGLEVLDILYDAKPELIITDIDMPGINGLQLIEQLKENPESRDIPIIACSALRFLDTLEGGKTDIKSKAISLGAELFLPKPLLKESLLSAVRNYLK